MIAAAYGVASDGNDSKLDSYELELYRRIQQYGVYAVMGRPVLYEREIRRMSIVNNIIGAYRDRSKSATWEAWTKENQAMASLLFKAQQMYDNEDY